MDNASKALIMAGAILISVMLVSLGVMLFSSASTQIEDAIDLSDANAIAMFNNQFLQYQGEQRGTAIIQLINAVNTSNAKYYEQVEFSGDIDDVNAITRNDEYKVYLHYDGGIIEKISIVESH